MHNIDQIRNAVKMIGRGIIHSIKSNIPSVNLNRSCDQRMYILRFQYIVDILADLSVCLYIRYNNIF